MKAHKCLKEWNATIEALGHGKQSVLIRSYNTINKEFLLYPTVNYTQNDKYLESFKTEEKFFVEENSLPKKVRNKTEIKYFAKVEKIIERPAQKIGLQKHYIWTSEHVKSYLKGKMAKIWLLRVYKLKEPYFADPTPGAIRYANLNNEVDLSGMKPVLTDVEFSKISKAIK